MGVRRAPSGLLGTAIGVLAWVTAPLGAGAAGTVCEAPFQRVQTPSPGTADNVLEAIDGPSSTDLWAVGRRYDGDLPYRTLILKGGGSTWTAVPSPSEGPGSNFLLDVSARAPDDAWAVGVVTGDPGRPSIRILTLHWDGGAWSSVPFPEIGDFSGEVPAIVSVTQDDAWLVGSYVADGTSHSLVARWDGHAWTLVPHPDVQYLVDVDATSATDAWATGGGGILHWDGTAWSRQPSPGPGSLAAVSARSPSDVWMVGAQDLATGGAAPTAAHWDGMAWTSTPVPRPDSSLPGAAHAELSAVSVTAADDAWAIGSYVDVSTGVGYAEPWVAHWDGRRWEPLPAPGLGSEVGASGSLTGVVAFGPRDVHVAGFSGGQTESLVAGLCPMVVRDRLAPAAARTTGPGAAAVWSFRTGGAGGHGIRDATGLALFDSGARPAGTTFGFAYTAAGRYEVEDPTTDARGVIDVPIDLFRLDARRVVVHWAVAPPPPGMAFDLQVLKPGSTEFAAFRRATTKRSLTMGPKFGPGSYRFRARLRSLETGARSGWSPVASFALA